MEGSSVPQETYLGDAILIDLPAGHNNHQQATSPAHA
jgi:hypothetical protein